MTLITRRFNLINPHFKLNKVTLTTTSWMMWFMTLCRLLWPRVPICGADSADLTLLDSDQTSTLLISASETYPRQLLLNRSLRDKILKISIRFRFFWGWYWCRFLGTFIGWCRYAPSCQHDCIRPTEDNWRYFRTIFVNVESLVLCVFVSWLLKSLLVHHLIWVSAGLVNSSQWLNEQHEWKR